MWREFIEERGLWLGDSVGAAEWALNRADALRAIELVEAVGGVILGGDVYAQRGARIEPAYANWSTTRRGDESREAYAKRSITESRAYISGYPMPRDEGVLFVLVI